MAQQNALQPGRYSAVVASTDTVAGVSWVRVTQGGVARINGMYEASTSGGTTVYLPTVKIPAQPASGGKLAIQNLGNAPANGVLIKFYLPTGQQVGEVGAPPIPPMAAFQVDLAGIGIPHGFEGSIVVTSPAPVAVVGELFPNSAANGGRLLTYSGWSTGATTLYAPFLAQPSKSLGASITVMNTANQPAMVSITHSDNSQPQQFQLAPMGSQTFVACDQNELTRAAHRSVMALAFARNIGLSK